MNQIPPFWPGIKFQKTFCPFESSQLPSRAPKAIMNPQMWLIWTDSLFEEAIVALKDAGPRQQREDILLWASNKETCWDVFSRMDGEKTRECVRGDEQKGRGSDGAVEAKSMHDRITCTLGEEGLFWQQFWCVWQFLVCSQHTSVFLSNGKVQVLLAGLTDALCS